MAGKRRARATTSWNERALRTRETHGRITSGVHRVHGAEHDAYILIAVIHRVGWPTSAALWSAHGKWQRPLARNHLVTRRPLSTPSAYPLTSRRRCSMQIHAIRSLRRPPFLILSDLHLLRFLFFFFNRRRFSWRKYWSLEIVLRMKIILSFGKYFSR